MEPSRITFFINLLKPSTMSKKRKGESGNPYQIPIVTLKKLIGVPLINTTKFYEVMKAIIQLVISRLRPICNNANLRKV
jgi:hypothetical protein